MLGYNSLALLASTNVIAFGPAVILFFFTIFPFPFITGIFMLTLFYHVLSFLFAALFWLALSHADTQVQYIFSLLFYFIFVEAVRIMIYPLYVTHRKRFAMIGSNDKLYDMSPLHAAFGSGVALGLCETMLIFSPTLILGQLGYVSYNTTLYPSVSTICGQFTPGFTPIPLVFSTSLAALSIFTVNVVVSILMNLYIQYVYSLKTRFILHFYALSFKLFGFLGPFLIQTYSNKNLAHNGIITCYSQLIYSGVYLFVTLLYFTWAWSKWYPKKATTAQDDGHSSTTPHSPHSHSVLHTSLAHNIHTNFLRNRRTNDETNRAVNSSVDDETNEYDLTTATTTAMTRGTGRYQRLDDENN